MAVQIKGTWRIRCAKSPTMEKREMFASIVSKRPGRGMGKSLFLGLLENREKQTFSLKNFSSSLLGEKLTRHFL